VALVCSMHVYNQKKKKKKKKKKKIGDEKRDITPFVSLNEFHPLLNLFKMCTTL
jgi:hypothetical protein